MDFVQAIQDVYEGNILLRPPYEGELPQDFPEELCRILAVSNGIEEMMRHPQTVSFYLKLCGEVIPGRGKTGGGFDLLYESVFARR